MFPHEIYIQNKLFKQKKKKKIVHIILKSTTVVEIGNQLLKKIIVYKIYNLKYLKLKNQDIFFDSRFLLRTF